MDSPCTRPPCFRKAERPQLCSLLPAPHPLGMAATGVLSKELVSRLLHVHFKDDKTKVSGDALQLMAELLKIFVVEAAVRGVRQAQAEDAILVDVDQLEKVLPQLLLDF
ncbi:centromere protein X isoform X2 [Aotus nancymaae]|uniref:centromere protein X isoform X2 n=1 Tax=Aotus nancymaae TaxID=37293 RepID=UPI0006259F2E|nr:centromere protein X isoform X1 [Aotus nancymaae]